MDKQKDTIIDDITPENIPEVQEEYTDEYAKPDTGFCPCGGTFVLVGRSQDAKTIFEVYECDICKAKKQTNRAK